MSAASNHAAAAADVDKNAVGPASVPQQAPVERRCRVCLDESEDSSSGPLFSPCKCTGSMRLVHVSCFERWRRANLGMLEASDKCGVCLYQYRIRRSFLGALLRWGIFRWLLTAFAMVLAGWHVGSMCATFLPMLEKSIGSFGWLPAQIENPIHLEVRFLVPTIVLLNFGLGVDMTQPGAIACYGSHWAMPIMLHRILNNRALVVGLAFLSFCGVVARIWEALLLMPSRIRYLNCFAEATWIVCIAYIVAAGGATGVLTAFMHIGLYVAGCSLYLVVSALCDVASQSLAERVVEVDS